VQARLVEMLSAASEFVREGQCNRRITVTDAPFQAGQTMYQMGLEGSFAEEVVEIRLGGRRLVVEDDGERLTIHTEFVRPLPFLLPLVLSNVDGCQIAPVHACAASFREKGVLIAGPGGSGRTGLLLKLLEQGAGFVSEDSCLLSSDGHILSTGPRMILQSEIGKDGRLKDNLSLLLRSHKLTGNVLFRLSALRIISGIASISSRRPLSRVVRRLSNALRVSLEVDSRELWRGRWVPTCRLDAVLHLSVHPWENGKIQQVSPQEMATRLLAINRLELKEYLELIQIHRFARPDVGPRLAESFMTYERVISAGVSGAACFVLSGPKRKVQQMALSLVETRFLGVGGQN